MTTPSSQAGSGVKMHYEADPSIIRSRKVAIIGFGSQGHAHARNLHDAGVDVIVGVRPSSSSIAEIERAGIEWASTAEAARAADVVMILVPDQVQADVYEADIAPHLEPGNALAFGHGFNIHYNAIQPPADVDVFMVAPKSPGHLVRRTFEAGRGVPCLVAVAQDASGVALDLALSYADAIGGTRAGVIETTFRDETETDLFGEQAVLCGGLEALVRTGFDTLTEAGYPAELAYFEVLHELKLIVDLCYEGGLEFMNHSISDTAEYGNYSRGPRLIGGAVKAEMKKILEEIQSGEFATEWLNECRSGGHRMEKLRRDSKGHEIEQVGRRLRPMMSWLRTPDGGAVSPGKQVGPAGRELPDPDGPVKAADPVIPPPRSRDAARTIEAAAEAARILSSETSR